MEAMTKSLFEEKPFLQDRASREHRLLAELNLAFDHHVRHCELFKRICDSASWSPDSPAQRLADLPFLPAQYFKEAGRQLTSVPVDRQYRALSSSATSGRASTVVLDRETARRQARAVAGVIAEFIGPQRRPMLICDLPPGIQRTAELSARAAAMLGFMTLASSHRHILKSAEGGQITADEDVLEATRKALAAEGKPVTIIGFTFLVYTALLEPLERAGKQFPLPAGSTILHIGGWKKLEDRKVDRKRLAAAAKAVFGVSAEHIVDSYGFTEQMGTVYAECAAGRKHAPAFADVIVRDPLTMRPVPDGIEGSGQFLSLVPESYPGFSVITDDIVRVLGRDSCPCGRSGTTFEVIGRHKSAEVRGCGDIIAEKITLSAVPAVLQAPRFDGDPTAAGVRRVAPAISYFSRGEAFRCFDGDRVLPDIRDWGAVEQRLRAAQRELAKLSVDDIIGVLAEASNEWLQPQSPFVAFHPHGLLFVATYVRDGGLQLAADASLRGSRSYLDKFRPDPSAGRRLLAVPRGLVVHWLAGNVPTLGFLSVMLSLVGKNANILKVPEAVSPLLPEMLLSVANARYRSPSGREISGRLLTDAIEAVWYPHDSADAAALSQVADVRVVWGGADAVRAIAGLPRRYDCDDIIFGPKLSLAAVGRESLANESLARRAARGIALDCSVFEQEACASAHTVFVEEGGALSPRAFADLLSEQMAKTNARIPRQGISGQLAGNVKSARMQHFLDGDVIAPPSLEWSVLFRNREERPPPIYGRTALVRPIGDLNSLPSYIDRDTQVVGLALAGPRRLAVAEGLARAGLDRITEAGSMADFAVPWDGLFPLDRLVRWVSLAR
ncbi:MAG TPA: acyl-CoA reductase [Reyranella sp.]|nr:acyl-CoA reductase [Reyranella sp.]